MKELTCDTYKTKCLLKELPRGKAVVQNILLVYFRIINLPHFPISMFHFPFIHPLIVISPPFSLSSPLSLVLPFLFTWSMFIVRAFLYTSYNSIYLVVETVLSQHVKALAVQFTLCACHTVSPLLITGGVLISLPPVAPSSLPPCPEWHPVVQCGPTAGRSSPAVAAPSQHRVVPDSHGAEEEDVVREDAGRPGASLQTDQDLHYWSGTLPHPPETTSTSP